MSKDPTKALASENHAIIGVLPAKLCDGATNACTNAIVRVYVNTSW